MQKPRKHESVRAPVRNLHAVAHALARIRQGAHGRRDYRANTTRPAPETGAGRMTNSLPLLGHRHFGGITPAGFLQP